LTQEQHARKEAQQELSGAREELSSVKDQLEFARRAIKAFQSSKTTTKEALCGSFSPPIHAHLPVGLLLTQLIIGISKVLSVPCRRLSYWKKRGMKGRDLRSSATRLGKI
jgi:hypothetical protein